VRTVLGFYKTLLCAMPRPRDMTHALRRSLRQGLLANAGKLRVLRRKEFICEVCVNHGERRADRMAAGDVNPAARTIAAASLSARIKLQYVLKSCPITFRIDSIPKATTLRSTCATESCRPW
jgi:hypothetical protein